MLIEEIQNLLNQISTITKKNNEILDATGGRFNMFSILGVDHYENTHSAIINEFLNPKGSHGLKDQFLNAFLNQLSNYFKEHPQYNSLEKFLTIFKSESAQATTEYHTSFGRIDILVEDKNGHTIILENKIYAGDQWEQLRRYNVFAKGKYKEGNFIILYLTLDGKEALEHSGKDVRYFQISHSTFIIEWLEKCVNISSRFPLVRETINQYINHLKKLTNQDMSTDFKNEITELLSQTPKNLEIAFFVSNTIDSLKKRLLEELHKIVEEIAIEENLEFSFGCKLNESYQGFNFTNYNWKYIKIGFEFQNRIFGGLEYGIVWKSKEKPIYLKEYIRKEFGGKCSDSWPFYTFIESPYYNWATSPIPWIGLKNGEIKRMIKFKIAFVLQKLQNVDI